MINFIRNGVAICCYAMATLIGSLGLLVCRIAQDTAELGLRADPSVVILKPDEDEDS